MSVSNSNSGARILQRLPRHMRGKHSSPADSSSADPARAPIDPPKKPVHSALRSETPPMARAQRHYIQEALRKKFKTPVEERNHDLSTEHGNTLDSDMMEEPLTSSPHPLHANQRGDGIALSQITNQEIKIRHENAKREQDKEHQLRLGLAPSNSPSNAPKPGYS